MADSFDIIKNAISAAEDSGNLPEPADGEVDAQVEETGGDDTNDTGTVSEGGSGSGEKLPADTTETSIAEVSGGVPTTDTGKKSSWSEEDLKVLEELGIKPEPSGRDNRIPYSRSIRTLVNTVKKDRARLSETHSKALADESKKRKELEDEVGSARNLDRLLQSDPDRYLATLAALYPDKYKRFVETGTTKPQPVAAVDLSTKPQPDVKFEDGSVGYSPAQLDKLNEWVSEQAVSKARAEFKAELDRTVGPVLQERRTQAELNSRLTSIRSQITTAKSTWGEQLYTENESAILAALKADDALARAERRQATPFETVVARVLVPRLNDKATKARETVLEEMKKAPKAADTKPAGQNRDVESKEALTTEDTVRAAVAKFKARR